MFASTERAPMRLLRVCALLAGVSAAALAFAAPAAAHVTVSAPGATEGSDGTVVTFHVPTESDTLSTIGLKVQLPLDHPFSSVLVAPQPGWTYRTVRTAGAVTEIDWTATSGSGIKPGEFGQFQLSVGPLPNVPTLSFKAIQVYSDGSTVNWTDVPAPGSTAEPPHPAPTLTLALAASPSPAAVGSTSRQSAGDSKSGDDSTLPLVLASVALAVAVLAAGLALFTRRAR